MTRTLCRGPLGQTPLPLRQGLGDREEKKCKGLEERVGEHCWWSQMAVGAARAPEAQGRRRGLRDVFSNHHPRWEAQARFRMPRSCLALTFLQQLCHSTMCPSHYAIFSSRRPLCCAYSVATPTSHVAAHTSTCNLSARA